MDQFILVRVIDMSNVDIANFQFDYDLVFAVMFMNGHGRVYSRYGSRTPWNSESRVSLAGLQYTMRQVLEHHAPTLRPKTGLEPEVAAYALDEEKGVALLARLRDLLQFLLPLYEAEGKAYLTVAFGCTGGHHRSVYVAERVAELLRELGHAPSVTHRDLEL